MQKQSFCPVLQMTQREYFTVFSPNYSTCFSLYLMSSPAWLRKSLPSMMSYLLGWSKTRALSSLMPRFLFSSGSRTSRMCTSLLAVIWPARVLNLLEFILLGCAFLGTTLLLISVLLDPLSMRACSTSTRCLLQQPTVPATRIITGVKVSVPATLCRLALKN